MTVEVSLNQAIKTKEQTSMATISKEFLVYIVEHLAGFKGHITVSQAECQLTDAELADKSFHIERHDNGLIDIWPIREWAASTERFTLVVKEVRSEPFLASVRPVTSRSLSAVRHDYETALANAKQAKREKDQTKLAFYANQVKTYQTEMMNCLEAL